MVLFFPDYFDTTNALVTWQPFNTEENLVKLMSYHKRQSTGRKMDAKREKNQDLKSLRETQ